MIVIYGYLERESGKVFKFHMNKSSFFKISASLYKCDPLITLLLKASRLNTRRGGGVLIRGSTVFISILKLKSGNVLLDFLIPLACTENVTSQ